MDKDFGKNQLKPGDQGFVYDKVVDFSKQNDQYNYDMADDSWGEDDGIEEEKPDGDDEEEEVEYYDEEDEDDEPNNVANAALAKQHHIDQMNIMGLGGLGSK